MGQSWCRGPGRCSTICLHPHYEPRRAPRGNGDCGTSCSPTPSSGTGSLEDADLRGIKYRDLIVSEADHLVCRVWVCLSSRQLFKVKPY